MSNAGDADKRPAASPRPTSGGLSAADRAGLVNVLKEAAMGESSAPVPKEDGAGGVVKPIFVWGDKVGSNFKSVTINGEVFSLGDCVRCLLEARGGLFGKLVKLFERQGKEMCIVRRFFSPSEISPAVKGLDYTPETKELFLASGDGPGVETVMSLGMVASRCLIFCTADESLNEVPTEEEVAAADYFFRRGYDPETEEVVGLDCVEEAIGAQKVYNKKEWLLSACKIPGRSSSQISASKMPRPSPAVSGSSPRQGTAKGTSSSIPEVSAAPSNDSAQPKLKVKKSDSLVRERHEVDIVEKEKEKENEKEQEKEQVKEQEQVKEKEKEKENGAQKQKQKKSALHPKGEMRSMPTTVVFEPGRSEHVVFAIPAPSKPLRNPRKPEITPTQAGKPPVSSKPISKIVHPDTKSEPLKASRPSSAQKLAFVGAKGGARDGAKDVAKGGAKDGAKTGAKDGPKAGAKDVAKGGAKDVAKGGAKDVAKGGAKDVAKGGAKDVAKDGAVVISGKKRKQENLPSEAPPKAKILKRGDGPNTFGEGERPFKVQERAGEGIAIATSHGAEKVPHSSLSSVFKRKPEEWDAATLLPAIQANRVLLLKNLVTGLNSDDLSEALSGAVKCRCEVRIIPPVSFSYKTTMALVRLQSSTKAEKVRAEIESNNILVENRLLTATLFRPGDFKPISKIHGHLEFQKENRDVLNEDYRDAVATSHFAQGNTIEFDFGIPWRVLDEQHEDQWRMLQVELNKKPQNSSK